MASFVESATLKVNDQSSAAIRRINAELKKLQATARSMKSIKVDINVRDRGINAAIANVRRLNQELARLRSSSRNINLSVTAGRMAQASAAIQRLTSQLNALKSARVNVQVSASGITQA